MLSRRALLGAGLLAPTLAYAQGFPSRNLTIIVPFAPGASSASTKFINGIWETKVPANTGANVFLTGLSYRVPVSLPGGIKNVKWTMDIEIDKDDVSLDWKWTAGVYTNFAGHSGLNIKPTDGLLSILNPLLGVANAGTPLNYSLNIVAGAMGAGLLNITNTYSSMTSLSCATNNSMVLSKQNASQSMSPGEQSLVSEDWPAIIQPNPSPDHFNIVVRGNAKDFIAISIFDIFGRLVKRYQGVKAGTVLQVGEGLTAGTYFAEVGVNDRKKTFKLIKLN